MHKYCTILSKDNDPAATNALYSPNEWPAINFIFYKSKLNSFSITLNIAKLVIKIAGWVISVFLSSSSDPFKIIFDKPNLRASSTLSNIFSLS